MVGIIVGMVTSPMKEAALLFRVHPDSLSVHQSIYASVASGYVMETMIVAIIQTKIQCFVKRRHVILVSCV